MNNDRPDYIPVEVWGFYQELLEPAATGGPSTLSLPKYKVPILRLLGLHPESPPKMEKTWRNLQRQIEEAKRPGWAVYDWRMLFSLLWTLPDSFDADAKPAVDRARELVPEIASLSAKLADALGEYNKLSSEHMISIPWEGLTCMDLIETAGRNQDRRRASSFEHFSLPYFGNSDGPRRVVDTRYLPQPHDMIRALATAFEGFYPMAIDESMDYANSKQTSRQHAIIRHFEDHWSDYQGQDRPMLRPPDVMAARFEIGAADLARILTALFGFDFSRESVTYARRQRREKRKN